MRCGCEPLRSLMTMEAALAPDAPPLFDARHDAELSHAGPGVSWLQEPAPNILFEYCHRVGDAEDWLKRCAHVFEDPLKFAQRLSQSSARSEEHTSELQSPDHIVFRLLL